MANIVSKGKQLASKIAKAAGTKKFNFGEAVESMSPEKLNKALVGTQYEGMPYSLKNRVEEGKKLGYKMSTKNSVIASNKKFDSKHYEDIDEDIYDRIRFFSGHTETQLPKKSTWQKMFPSRETKEFEKNVNEEKEIQKRRKEVLKKRKAREEGQATGFRAADQAWEAEGKGSEELWERAKKGNKSKEQVSATPKSGEPVSQDAGGSVETKGDFDNNSGAGRDTVEERARERLSDRDIKNSDKFHVEDKLDTYQGYKARAKELEKQLEKQEISKEDFNKKLGELNEQHGIGAGVDPEKFFLDQINGKATTWDWVRGNNVIEIGAGGALAAGAIASCFSNKGKMSNSELYGQNF